jgi:hypothetical protein
LVTFGAYSFHVCTATFNYPMAFLRPEMKWAYPGECVYVLRPDYDQTWELSESYRLFEKFYGPRFTNARLAQRYNELKKTAVTRDAAHKRSNGEGSTVPEKRARLAPIPTEF